MSLLDKLITSADELQKAVDEINATAASLRCGSASACTDRGGGPSARARCQPPPSSAQTHTQTRTHTNTHTHTHTVCLPPPPPHVRACARACPTLRMTCVASLACWRQVAQRPALRGPRTPPPSGHGPRGRCPDGQRERCGQRRHGGRFKVTARACARVRMRLHTHTHTHAFVTRPPGRRRRCN